MPEPTEQKFMSRALALELENDLHRSLGQVTSIAVISTTDPTDDEHRRYRLEVSSASFYGEEIAKIEEIAGKYDCTCAVLAMAGERIDRVVCEIRKVPR